MKEKKIYIYDFEVLQKGKRIGGVKCNLVTLKRPEGLEEHKPKTGEIIKIKFPENCITKMVRIIRSVRNSDNYYVTQKIYTNDFNIKLDNNSFSDIINNIKEKVKSELIELCNNTNIEIQDEYDLDNRLGAYMDISSKMFDDNKDIMADVLSNDILKAMKDKLKEEKSYIYNKNQEVEINLYTNTPFIEEFIDTVEFITNNKLVIYEEEVKDYRIYIRVPVYRSKNISKD